jgi:hypothetical protein
MERALNKGGAMKHSFFLLTFLILSLLTACSDKGVTQTNREIPSDSSTNGSQSTKVSRSVLLDFLDTLNNQQVGDTLDLFNDEAVITMVDQINVGTTLSENESPYTYSGKAEIKGWLEYQARAISRIVPEEFSESNDIFSVEAAFYYPNQVCNIRVEAQTQGGMFNSLYFYVEKVS